METNTETKLSKKVDISHCGCAMLIPTLCALALSVVLCTPIQGVTNVATLNFAFMNASFVYLRAIRREYPEGKVPHFNFYDTDLQRTYELGLWGYTGSRWGEDRKFHKFPQWNFSIDDMMFSESPVIGDTIHLENKYDITLPSTLPSESELKATSKKIFTLIGASVALNTILFIIVFCFICSPRKLRSSKIILLATLLTLFSILALTISCITVKDSNRFISRIYNAFDDRYSIYKIYPEKGSTMTRLLIVVICCEVVDVILCLWYGLKYINRICKTETPRSNSNSRAHVTPTRVSITSEEENPVVEQIVLERVTVLHVQPRTSVDEPPPVYKRYEGGDDLPPYQE
ncbi:CYFA0S25e00837g1_1 [Cyberlindnera fabianii]|uniref:CYFA0S25e00837g1_1 n=2 Tax=Cyberlindnera fabianii TaxID=36022 RepID=A0A061BFL5_CYBFA|nr:CYFA0S25e00837g1_1 [Cyberlindnera fabianii]